MKDICIIIPAERIEAARQVYADYIHSETTPEMLKESNAILSRVMEKIFPGGVPDEFLAKVESGQLTIQRNSLYRLLDALGLVDEVIGFDIVEYFNYD